MKRLCTPITLVVLVTLGQAGAAVAAGAASGSSSTTPTWARTTTLALHRVRYELDHLPAHPASVTTTHRAAVRRRCAKVERAAGRLSRLTPVPKARLELRWAKAVHRLARAARSCATAFHSGTTAARRHALTSTERAGHALVAAWAAVQRWADGATTTTTTTTTTTSSTTTTTTTTTTTAPPVTAPPVTAPPVTAPPVTAPPVTAPPATAPPATTPPAAAGCSPLTDGGNCYEPGEYCRDATHGVSGTAGDGEPIVCETNDGWRWEPA